MINKTNLPEGWNIYKIKEVGEVVTGTTPSMKEPENYGESLVWIKPPDLDMDKFVDNSERKISEIGRKKVRILPAGSVLVSCIGNIGKVAIAGCELCTNQQINSIIPKGEIVDNNFLYYSIKRMRPYLGKIASSAVVPLLNKKDFSNVKIALPPVSIQNKIVGILEKAEQLKEWRKESDKLTDDYFKSVFLEMFGDPIRNDKNWDTMPLQNISTISRGKSQHRPRNAPFLFGGKYPFIQTGDISNSDGRITSYSQTLSEAGIKQSKLFPKGTIVMSIAANIGYTAVLDFNSYFPDSIVGIIPNDDCIHSVYLHYCLKFYQNKLEREASSTAQKNINLRILNPLEIPVPPIELQKKFTKVMENIEQLKEMQRESQKQIYGLFNVLMQKAFRGELIC